MFAQLLGAFQGFFSRAFWLGSFIPVAVIATVHLVLAIHVFPGLTTIDLLAPTGKGATYFTLLFAALVVIAYAVSPLVPLMRGILDGSLLPTWLHNALRREHVVRALRVRDQIGAAASKYADYQWLREERSARLKAARQQGIILATVSNQPAIAKATSETKRFARRISAGRVPDVAVARSACDALEDALRLNSAALSSELDPMHRRLLRSLGDAEVYAEHLALTLTGRSAGIAALNNPQATRMADARLATEQYCYEAYGVEFGYLWPRLQLVLPDQGSLVDRLGFAKAQLDFALLSLILVLTVALVWMPILAWCDATPFVFLSLSALVPLALTFLYELAVETQVAFGAIVKAVIDRYRFDVLKTVERLPLPATLVTERELWTALQNATRHGIATNLTYRHTSP